MASGGEATDRPAGLTHRLVLAVSILAASAAVAWWIGRIPGGLHDGDASGRSSSDSTGSAGVEALNNRVASVVEEVLPTVISINTERLLTFAPPEESPGVAGGTPRVHREPGVGSGVIVTPQGHAITNWHVVSGERVDIFVTLHGEDEPRRATLHDHDEERDIALILIDPRRPGEVFPAIRFGDSDLMRPGHFVIALGNPLNMAETVTLGIVSNRARRVSDTFTSFLQTDCVINPGNSGGPLINLKGELIGINTRLVVGPDKTPVSQGYGLAIPSNDALDALERLRNKDRPRGYLGLTVDDYPPSAYQEKRLPESAVVLGVEAGSPAGVAGLRKDDVVTAFDGQPVRGANGFFRLLRKKLVGDVVVLTVTRGEDTITLRPEVGDLDAVFEQEEDPAPISVGGLTVRDLRLSERSRWQIRDNSGVIVESVAETSPLQTLLSPGELILGVADTGRHRILSATDAKAFQGHLQPLLRTGGLLYVYRHGMERIPFPPLP